MILAGTGHRPDKLGGYSPRADALLTDFAARVLTRLAPSGVISGMALGWDQALAVASVRLGIPFVAAVPFRGQESRWPRAARDNYDALIRAASHVHVVTPEIEWQELQPWAMQRRNEWMVDNSTALLALWNGDRKGGTFNCIQYAREGARRIINVWDEWESGSYLI